MIGMPEQEFASDVLAGAQRFGWIVAWLSEDDIVGVVASVLDIDPESKECRNEVRDILSQLSVVAAQDAKAWMLDRLREAVETAHRDIREVV